MTFELLEDLELLRRQIYLARALIGLRQPVVRLRELRFQPYRVAQLPNGVRVPLLIREQDSQFEKTFRELGIEGNRSPEQSFDLPHIWRLGSGGLPFPEAQRVVEVRQRVSRLHLHEAREAPGNLAAKFGSDAVQLAEELLRARV